MAGRDANAIDPPRVAIRRFVERTENFVHWSELARGGHFAAPEAPHLFVDDVRAFFRLVHERRDGIGFDRRPAK